MKYVIGIDGGGTKTQAVLLDRSGRELGRGRAGGANPTTVGREGTAAAMRHAIQTALMVAAGAADTPPTLEDVAGVGAGMAGITRSQTWLDQMLSDALPGAAVLSHHDAAIALVGALGRRCGIVAIGGTGSTIYAVNDDGQDALVDGWGYMLGDESSGYAIGQEAVRVFLRVLDGRLAPCPLSEAVQAELGLAHRDAVLDWCYKRIAAGDARGYVSEAASLARVVMQLADAGDAMAQAIIDRAAAALVMAVTGAWRRLDLGKCEVGLVGGALRWDGALARSAVAQLREALPDVTPVQPRSDPATGAAWMAMERLGWRQL
jgi:N-acetylglucosamine kinase-like BadF-type ATPase